MLLKVLLSIVLVSSQRSSSIVDGMLLFCIFIACLLLLLDWLINKFFRKE